MSNKYSTRILVLSGTEVTASSSNLYLNGVPFSAAGTGTNFSVSGSNIIGYTDISGAGSVTVFQLANKTLISGSSVASQGSNGDGINLSGNLTQSGSSLLNSIGLISGQIINTGQTLYNYFSSLSGNLTNSGQQLFNYYSSLSGNLSQTGANLQNQINAIGSVANIVYTTGNQLVGGQKTFSGNHIFVDPYPSGLGGNPFTGFSGLVFQTGRSGVFATYGTGNVISVDFYNRIISGGTWNIENLAQLGSSGSTLFNNSSLTGSSILNSIGLVSGNLISTGQTLYNYYSALSGALSSTGANLQNQINALSGAVSLTGASLLVSIAAVSGNLGSTGQNLQNQINTLGSAANIVYTTGNQTIIGNKTFSGNFILRDPWPSGIGFTGSSGLVFLTGSGNPRFQLIDTGNTVALDVYGRVLSGTWNVQNLNQLTNSGANFISRLDALSGNLTTTGQTLYNYYSSLSGKLSTTGTLLSAVQITGSSIINNPNFTGIGGTLVILSGNNTVLISGGAGGGQGNTTNNYFTNSGSGFYLFRSGLNNNVNKQFIQFPTILDNQALVIASVHNDFDDTVLPCQISGTVSSGFWAVLPNTTNNTGYYLDIIASNYTNTGFAVSVIVNNSVVNPVDNSNAINLSGNLTQTGSSLLNSIGLVSGNLIATGQTLYNYYSALSGALSSTGANLQGQINALSGSVSSTGASLLSSIGLVSGNLIATGQTLYNYYSALSGNVSSTGANLQNQINNLSSVRITGSNIINDISLTGNFGLSIIRNTATTAIISGNRGLTCLIANDETDSALYVTSNALSGLKSALITSSDIVGYNKIIMEAEVLSSANNDAASKPSFTWQLGYYTGNIFFPKTWVHTIITNTTAAIDGGGQYESTLKTVSTGALPSSGVTVYLTAQCSASATLSTMRARSLRVYGVI